MHKTPFYVLIVFFVSSLTFADTIEISPDTSTITEAVTRAAEGDIIMLLPGTYSGEGNRNIELGEKSLTIISKEGPEKTIINCFSKDHLQNRAFIFSNSIKKIVISGLSITKGSVFISKNNTEKSENTITAFGGTLLIDHANPVFENCVFTECQAELGGSVAMIINNSQPRFSKCLFKNNQGDVIYIMRNSRAILSHCLFTENRAKNPDASGCIYIDGIAKDFSLGHLQANNCIFENNQGFSAGVILNSGEALFYNCLFTNNKAQSTEAAYFPSGYGGAVTSYGHIALNNCTFYGNDSSQAGGALYLEHNPVYSNLRNNSYVRNSILWANKCENNRESEQIALENTSAFIQFSCIQNFTGQGKEILSKDPQFMDPAANDFHLKPLSYCINAGDPSFSEEEIDLDLSGNQRIFNNRVDIGAYEQNIKISFMELLSRELVFDIIYGTQTKQTKQAYFRNLVPQLMFWKAVSKDNWIILNSHEGQADAVYTPLNIQVEASKMKPGVYETKILLAFEGSDMNQEIKVKLNIHGSKIELSKEQIEFTLDKRFYNLENPIKEYFTISNSGYLPLNWSVRADSPYINITPQKGTLTITNQEVTVSVDPKKLQLGENRFSIQIIDNFAINSPLKIPVSISVIDSTPKMSQAE
ncbi:MAG: right-handed parallel beta-helix repeat-containing protein [Spirochaetales bacterium]|nr:right-handed parallel beta-helix repeat-containing protein [Spirochaetales bacterium]